MFAYTLPNEDPKDEKVVRGSLNLEKVIRTVEYEPGKIVVLMDDFHPETRNVPIMGKNGKPTMTKSTETLSSQIFLNTDDTVRFRALTEV